MADPDFDKQLDLLLESLERDTRKIEMMERVIACVDVGMARLLRSKVLAMQENMDAKVRLFEDRFAGHVKKTQV